MADNNLSLLEKLKIGVAEFNRIEKSGIQDERWTDLFALNQIYDIYNNKNTIEAEKYLIEAKYRINEHYSEIVNGIPSQPSNVSTDEEAWRKGMGFGGKRISKGKSNKVAKKPVVSQKKQSIYKEIFGKQMKIYKMPDSRKEYVKYKGELHPISEYKSLMKQKAMAKSKPKK